jgi:hypothetical protein
MSKIHIVKADLSSDTLMFCGARLSQNSRLEFVGAPHPSVDLRRKEPDTCDECLKNWKVTRQEQPKESVGNDKPRLGNHEGYAARGRSNKQEQDDGYDKKRSY